MARQLFITDTEARDSEAIYWIGNDQKPKQFGVVFPDGNFFNIARQGVAESILFSLALANDMIEQIDEG